MAASKTKLTPKQTDELLQTVKHRFEKHKDRHKGISWGEVEERLRSKHSKLRSLFEMEETGGEPDVVGIDKKTGELLIYDCAFESPKGRRSLCYDHDALESRKEHKPKYSAMQMAEDMGIEMLNEDQYRYLQQLGNFDTKTSSWLVTPPDIRKLGGAIFGDYRYGTVFIYHNGAESYYASRGFRGCLRV
ncbi:MAG TPA: DUF4256 domain-containing protein [Parasegetibacter sp.]|jgi:hypothetical protein